MPLEWVPSIRELKAFMIKECAPECTFEFRARSPLRMDPERRIIYIGAHVLRQGVIEYINQGWDWKVILREHIRHEKAHLKLWPIVKESMPVIDSMADRLYDNGISPDEFWMLQNTVQDWIIEGIYFIGDERHRDVSRKTQLLTYQKFSFLPIEARLSTKMAYYIATLAVALGNVDLDTAMMDFMEQDIFVKMFSEALKKIKSDSEFTKGLMDCVEVRIKHWRRVGGW